MKKGLISALIIIMFMSAIETSIISLATPAIGKDLGVQQSLAHIFTVYMLAIVITTPLVGEIMKRIGAKWAMITGVIIFIIGSMLSGASFTFLMLIISRFIQGIGAGIMMTMGNIIPKIAFPIPYRYKVMGMVGSVWGISSIVGPLLGGFILTYLNWSFLFHINVPLAFLAIFLVLRYFQFETETEKVNLDIKGLLLFYVFLAFIMFALLNKGTVINALSFIIAIAVLVMFIRFEKAQAHPFIPVRSFTKRIGLVMTTDLIYALILMGTNIFLPIYLQVEKGLSPLMSGLTTFPISIFWLTSTFVLKHLESKLSVKRVYQISFVSMFIASLIIWIKDASIMVSLASIFLGLSFGIVFTKNIVTIQESASPRELGSMMSTYSLLKFIGSTTGSVVMSAVYYSGVFKGIDNNMMVMMIIALLLIALYQFSKINIEVVKQ
ncbi:MFS transporter [Macrococcus sp. DPC7161]|uniref:MFS transporter n=1 Tax=Macrococcus sp. DPC7161 TaxID=2507060 RepID=UPI00100AD4BE|nr:MFS transporter [Macrococcus sp. DPC7161]RXK17248.1 MFS transporter [Macrococcus sp. DPC7161]